jgi:hypothetical protein
MPTVSKRTTSKNLPHRLPRFFNQLIGENLMETQTTTRIQDTDLSNVTFGQLFATKAPNPKAKPSDKDRKHAEVKAICDEGLTIAAEHDQFNNDHVLRTNKALYVMLTKIYEYTLRINESPLKEQIIEAMRDDLKGKKIKTTSKTPWITTVIKYVVHTDRQTASNYSRVINVAFGNDLAVDELSDFIEQRGGITKIHKTDAVIEDDKVRRENLQGRMDALRDMIISRALAEGVEIDSDDNTLAFPIAAGTKEKKESSKYTGDFVVMLTVYDAASETYRIGLQVDFGRPFEDSIMRHMQSRLAMTTEEMNQVASSNYDDYKKMRNAAKSECEVTDNQESESA